MDRFAVMTLLRLRRDLTMIVATIVAVNPMTDAAQQIIVSKDLA